MRLTAKQIKERDAKRDIGAELLQAVRDLKAGKAKITARVAKTKDGKAVFNRVTGLKDSWGK
jgi:hypothetical protein